MSQIQHAQIDWDERGNPHSRSFGDKYFSTESGQAETRHVFIDQNDLPARFAALADGDCLAIGETGFGTGLNFFCAWQVFEAAAPAGARLHFVSVEKFPLSRDDLARALTLWPGLARYTEALLDQYVAIHEGFQQLLFDAGRVTLTLLVGDALGMLPQLDAHIDAWFLDGFAPAKNPEMWQPALFAEMARLSTPGATLGTFTATGWVRRALIAAGFAMQRVPGIGGKREIMRGRFEGWPQDVPAPAPIAPWYRRPPRPAGERKAIVVGAGLAGCATAASLAARGWRVTLVERHADIAGEASGNPQGVLYLKLSAHGTALSRLVVAGFGHTRRLLQRLQGDENWQACGVLQLAFDAKEATRQAHLAEAFPADLLLPLDREQAEARAGVSLPSGGLFYPDAGWVHPPALCALFAAQPGVTLRTHRQVLELRREDGLWHARDGERLIDSAPILVLATAAEVKGFAMGEHLPLKRIRGQVSRLPANAASLALATVVCADGYIAPPRLGEHTLGASFDFQRDDTAPSLAEHEGNLVRLHEISPALADALAPGKLEEIEGRVAFRCTTPDYLPMVGPLADREAFLAHYAMLGKDARQVPDIPCPWLDGLYLNTGHGSRGLITAPLSGELLAAWLNGDPLPVPRNVAEACHPNRFMLRESIRGARSR